MCRKIFPIFCLLFGSNFLFSQQVFLKGSVVDTTEKITLKYASIAILRASDSVLVRFGRSGNDGKFSIPLPSSGKYVLLITYPDYAEHSDFIEVGGNTDLGVINLLTKVIILQNVIVRASPVRMKGDTLSFSADSFRVREGATVEDLLKRLPGLSVNSKGEITAHGRRVEKVLVDGDEFFGDDPTLATRNLQADAVKEVQVFDKKSDQATFTGVDDGQSQKTINLKLKDEFKRGYFGKIKLGGGLPNRWENQAMINAFKDQRKFSVYGIMANTNNNALGWLDESQFGGNMNANLDIGEAGSVMIGGQSDDFGGSDGYYGEGLPSAWNVGTSYGNKWNENRSSIIGAYRFQKLKAEANTSVITQNILPDTQFFNNESGRTLATRMRHRGQIRSELFIDSSQSLTFTLSGSFGESNTYNNFLSQALNSKQQPVNISDRTTTADGVQSQFSGTALYKLKFKKSRRTFSLSVSNLYNEIQTDGFLLTYNEFYNETGIYKKDTIDQRKDNYAKGNSIGGRLAYSEPVGKLGIVEINYGYTQTNSREKRLSYDKSGEKYESLDSIFSNDFTFNTIVQRTGAGYRFNGKKLQYGFGGDVVFTDWQQDDLFRDTIRLYDFTNFFPRANMSYKLGQFSSLRINYSGNTRAPSVNQLQPVADNNDPLNIIVGNPNLVQAFNHRFSVQYNLWKVLANSGMWVSISYNPSSNDFSTRDIVDEYGRRVSQTVNVNGNYNIGAYIGYNFLWNKPDINIDMSLNPTLNKSTNFINGIENQTTSRNLGISTSFRKEIEEKYSIEIQQGVVYNFSESSIRPELTTQFWTSNSRLDVKVDLPKSIVLSTDFDFNWRQKTDVFDRNNNAFIWNASVEKKIFKKEDIRLGFSMRDILNENIGFQRDISSNYISERTYDVIRQYWLVTLHWNFNKGPQKGEEDDDLE